MRYPSDSEVEADHSISLTCFAEGTSLSVITWTRDDDVTLVDGSQLTITTLSMSSLSLESVLIISNATMEDGGLYSCTASGAGGNDTASFNLLVTGKAVANSLLAANI